MVRALKCWTRCLGDELYPTIKLPYLHSMLESIAATCGRVHGKEIDVPVNHLQKQVDGALLAFGIAARPVALSSIAGGAVASRSGERML